MEFMLHYAWQHRMFPLGGLTTTDGRRIEVISPGIHNNDAGPDFLNARIEIDGMVWVGHVEIHLRASDWFRHHHEADSAYDAVVLHVVEHADAEAVTSKGERMAQVEMAVPELVRENYNLLMAEDRIPRCGNPIPVVERGNGPQLTISHEPSVLSSLPRLLVTSWLAALTVERLEWRMEQILTRRERCDKDWEQTLFVTIARNFGFGKNGDAFEQWALSIPMSAISKHRDDLFQIEAIFFGQAGLLESPSVTNRELQSASLPEPPDYFLRLKREYNFMKVKFGLQPLSSSIWKFARLRPQNFPHIRIAQLATMYHEGRLNLSRLLVAADTRQIHDLLTTSVSDFWQTHYTFTSEPSDVNAKHLNSTSKDLIVINGVVPTLFAYGRYKSDEDLCERAIGLLESLPPEHNSIIRTWHDAGIECRSAADSQALLQLTTRYCQPRDCLHCRFGHEYIKRNPGYLREE